MQLATGKVANGKVVVEGLDLPEGATVTVLTRENAPAVKLSPALSNCLFASLALAARWSCVALMPAACRSIRSWAARR